MADVNPFGGFLLIGVMMAAYCIPWIVAHCRGHHQMMAIAVLNLLLGWTFVCWVVALVWACTEVRPRIVIPSPPAPLFPRTARTLRHPVASR